MSYTTESGRRQILDDAAAAADVLGEALVVLGDAYEEFDEYAADQIEERAFRPLQAAYGQLKRTLTEFAARHDLPARPLRSAQPGLRGENRVVLGRVADAAQEADRLLAELQDSLLPVEVGDEALRAGLARARTLIAPVPGAVDAIIRTLGR